MNFIIELKVITAGCHSMKRERLVVADTKDEAYDKFFATPTIKAVMNKTDAFSVYLRQIEEIK
jgi:hypothetical protein